LSYFHDFFREISPQSIYGPKVSNAYDLEFNGAETNTNANKHLENVNSKTFCALGLLIARNMPSFPLFSTKGLCKYDCFTSVRIISNFLTFLEKRVRIHTYHYDNDAHNSGGNIIMQYNNRTKRKFENERFVQYRSAGREENVSHRIDNYIIRVRAFGPSTNVL
jgi:hypothetical protein